VGDGDDRPELERLAEESGVAQRVVFAGTKVGEELATYYRACDVFVMPSIKEGFGIVFLEAMAFGKPVVGGNHGGTPEAVQDGVTGFLVQYGDESALADRLSLLLRDAELRARMGEAGRRHVAAQYTFGHFSERLTGVLAEIYARAEG
ncbi:MAG: glycosyltransferase family 4 protein, partial [Chloroflexi bacterium]|nr:glycosyltransferase family 4 protein [Chloroflexota bacterium]